MDELIVYVVDCGRRFLQMRWQHPETGKWNQRSARTANRRDAERAAAKWEAELRAGAWKQAGRVRWAEFRRRYETEQVSGMARDTGKKIATVFNAIERHVRPRYLHDVTGERISHLQGEMRRLGRQEPTLASHMAHLRAALQWGVDVGMLDAVPKMPRIRLRSQKVMKGRPLSDAEFDQLFDAVESVVEPEHVATWKRYLRGMWLSGLRLRESLCLTWDDDGALCVDLSGAHPLLKIPAHQEKGKRTRLLPIVPEFAEFLLETPKPERTGLVFDLRRRKHYQGNPRMRHVSRTGTNIGKAAGVIVDARSGKAASMQDLRRSFGFRWSRRVMPAVLQELMRHESIEVTMRYYAGRNAEATAAQLWAEHARRDVCDTSFVTPEVDDDDEST